METVVLGVQEDSMWEYRCLNTATGEEELYFGYNFKDATKNCDHTSVLKIIGYDYID